MVVLFLSHAVICVTENLKSKKVCTLDAKILYDVLSVLVLKAGKILVSHFLRLFHIRSKRSGKFKMGISDAT